MSKPISDQKLNRQISNFLKHLPNQAELNGERQGSSFYRRTDEKTFIEAHRQAYSHITGLGTKFKLTNVQKKELTKTQDGIVHRVEAAFDGNDNPPANLENFLKNRRTG